MSLHSRTPCSQAPTPPPHDLGKRGPTSQTEPANIRTPHAHTMQVFKLFCVALLLAVQLESVTSLKTRTNNRGNTRCVALLMGTRDGLARCVRPCVN